MLLGITNAVILRSVCADIYLNIHREFPLSPVKRTISSRDSRSHYREFANGFIGSVRDQRVSGRIPELFMRLYD